MNADQFEKIFHDQIAQCEDILLSKAREYADDDDRLHNFNVAAAMTGGTPIDALAGFMVKHTVSIYDMCRESEKNFSMEKWDEKIVDHINYLILLKALVVEKALTEGIRKE